MKIRDYFIVLLTAVTTLPSCNEEDGIISTFEFSVSFPEEKIVDGTASMFKVTSNRPWTVESQQLTPGYETDIDFAGIAGFLDRSIVYEAGTRTFKVPAEAVVVKKTHKGRLTIAGRDVETGTVKKVSAVYTAYYKNEYQLEIEKPVVHNGEEFVFSIYSPSGSTEFTLVDYNFYLADGSIVAGKTYQLDPSTHRCTFRVPVKAAESKINADLNMVISDESGALFTLTGTYSVLMVDAILSSDNVSMYSPTFWDEQPIEQVRIDCKGGFTVSLSQESTGSVEFSRSYLGGFDGESSVDCSDKDGATLYFRGLSPGNARIVVSPAVAKGDASADIQLDVWVKPMMVLYVGGDFSYVRNKILKMRFDDSELHGFNRIRKYWFYENTYSGGWTGSPDRIYYRMVPISSDVNLTGLDATKSVVTDPMRVSLFGLAASPASCHLLSGVKRVLGDDFFTRTPLMYSKLTNTSFDVTFLVDGGRAEWKSDRFWNNGNSVAYPSGRGLTVAFTGREEVDAKNMVGREFNYRNVPVTGGEDKLTIQERNWNFPYGSGEYFPYMKDDHRRYYLYVANGTKNYVDIGDDAYHLFTTDPSYIYPFRTSFLSSGSNNLSGLTYHLNKWNDVMAESGRQNDNGCKYTPSTGDAYSKNITQWLRFGVTVDRIAYDTSLYDVVGVVYGFDIYDDVSSDTYLGGADFWWHGVNSGLFYSRTRDGKFEITSKEL